MKRRIRIRWRTIVVCSGDAKAKDTQGKRRQGSERSDAPRSVLHRVVGTSVVKPYSEQEAAAADMVVLATSLALPHTYHRDHTGTITYPST